MKKKLVLKKEVVASLDNSVMQSLRGGKVENMTSIVLVEEPILAPGHVAVNALCGGSVLMPDPDPLPDISATQCGMDCDELPTHFAVCGNQNTGFGCIATDLCGL